MRAGQIGGMAGGMEAEAFALARLSARAAGGMLLESPGRRHTREHARGTTSASAVGSYSYVEIYLIEKIRSVEKYGLPLRT